jgi:uncharacterized spore protein YtfJ
MSDDLNRLIIESIPDQEQANALMERLFSITRPKAVFSKPVTQGEYTVITASELTAGLGYGYGGGGGVNPRSGESSGSQPMSEGGFGRGGGGGGGTTARPVAAIIMGPDGVRVEPIVDPTKIAIAFFTAFGAMMIALRKMRQASQG